MSAEDFGPFGNVLEGRSINNGLIDANYKFTGKERDTETGTDDFGARSYDSRIWRWTVCDPLKEKYPGISPYIYAVDNPTTLVDYNGKDFGFYVDHDKRTIKIRANYYVENGDDDLMKDVSQSLTEWNSMTGTYTDANGNEYTISFDLQAKGSMNPDLSAALDEVGNIVTKESDQKFAVDCEKYDKNQNKPEDVGGLTLNSKIIRIPNGRGNINTLAHEIGHTLTLGEYESGGVMSYPHSWSTMSPVQPSNAEMVTIKGLGQLREGESGNHIIINANNNLEGFQHSWFHRIFTSNIDMRKR